jgi:voltage-gated potassium channel
MSRFHAPAPFDSDGWRKRCFDTIFGYETRAGRAFDVALVIVILISVGVVLADSVSELNQRFGRQFFALEWFFTLLFTVEYLARLWAVREPLRYARSFYPARARGPGAAARVAVFGHRAARPGCQ